MIKPSGRGLPLRGAVRLALAETSNHIFEALPPGSRRSRGTTNKLPEGQNPSALEGGKAASLSVDYPATTECSSSFFRR